MDKDYLITPKAWADLKRKQATEILGTPEAAELLADAKKFDLCYDLIAKLKDQLQFINYHG